jgi:small subunit ribosomal protein S4
MARYTGPQWKVSRALNHPIFDNEDFRVRPTKPGPHNISSKKVGSTAYAQQFHEKQKIKKYYGMQERQFRRFFSIALKSKGNTANRLMELLEMRLDNVIYRLGLAASRPQARQFVSHGLVTVNGKKLDIPSATVKPGDEIKLVSKVQDAAWYKAKMESIDSASTPKWLERYSDGGKILIVPTSDMFDKSFNPRLVVELYNR